MGEPSACDREKLVDNFQFIGVTPDDDVLAKCVELCIVYKLDEEELVDQWAAFSISSSKNAAISLQGLELMERKELANKKVVVSVVNTPERKKVNKPVQPSQVSTTPKSTRTVVVEKLTQEVTQSPASQVKPYSERLQSGEVILTYGTNITIPHSISRHPISVKQFGEPLDILHADAKYMFETMTKKMASFSSIITDVAQGIADRLCITLPDKFNKGQGFPGFVYGRIASDSEGKLNNVSVTLELPYGQYSKGEAVPLNLTNLPGFSIFPGQVAVVQGVMRKNVLVVDHLYTNVYTPPKSLVTLPEPIQIIAAAGPFTLKSNMSYEPLQDLLKYVMEKRPHVLILTGPFIDAEHDNVADGSMTESFDSFFMTLVESIMEPFKGMDIQVIFVPSHREVSHHPIYPTPPYEFKYKYPNLLCVSDPALIDINGVIIGINTVDILFELGKQELRLSTSVGGDRMARLSELILNQLSFYPLYPLNKGSIHIDHTLFEKYGLMTTSPHILLLPSNFKHFIKLVNSCVVINPERLVKGYSGGTFTRFVVSGKEKLDIFCEIVRV